MLTGDDQLSIMPQCRGHDESRSFPAEVPRTHGVTAARDVCSPNLTVFCIHPMYTRDATGASRLIGNKRIRDMLNNINTINNMLYRQRKKAIFVQGRKQSYIVQKEKKTEKGDEVKYKMAHPQPRSGCITVAIMFKQCGLRS